MDCQKDSIDAGGFERDVSYKWKYNRSTWLPKLFHKGGHFNQKHQWDGRSEEEQRVLAIMDWVQEHNFEHRAWMTAWGQQKEPEFEGTSKDWTIYYKPAPTDNHVFGHAQLQKSIGYTARYTRQPLAPAYGESSIVRKVT